MRFLLGQPWPHAGLMAIMLCMAGCWSVGSVASAAENGIELLADEDYAPALQRILGQARESIDVTMFSCVLPKDAGPTHPVRRILEQLIARAAAGVTVRMVLDRGIPPSRQRPGDEAPSTVAAEFLRAAGIAVRWDEDERTTHTKSLVIDGRWCIVGSTNWTASALRHNREQSVLCDSPQLAAQITARFTALWQIASPVR
jgi:phosphatidylserine/phosphatidylglycerophosphate/cardiolipin synthase-like enzyme